jgi:hypothetical protein
MKLLSKNRHDEVNMSRKAEDERRRKEEERRRREEEEMRRVRVVATVGLRAGARVYGKPYCYDGWVYGANFDLGELIGDRGVIYHRGGCAGPCHAGDLYVA